MRPPSNFTRIIDRRRYSTETATLIASDCYWDGHNFERSGRNTFLYRTPNGNYFTVCLSQWPGEQDNLTPVSLDEAIDMYEGSLTEHDEFYSDAFPDVTIEEA